MPCVCESCAQHARILGLDESPRTRAVLRKGYRTAAKLWHPDRYEREPAKRSEAEEHFKQIQIAYRELTEHYENPVQWLIEQAFTAHRSPEPFSAASYHAEPDRDASGDGSSHDAAPRKASTAPPIFFDGAPGCFVAPDFSPNACRIVAAHLRDAEQALAIVDLSGPASLGSLAQFILLTDSGVFVRDHRGIVSLLWYDDMGKVRLTATRRRGLAGLWQKFFERLSGTQQKFVLEIWRRDGTLFHSIAGKIDDSIKKIIYNFLQQERSQAHR